MDEIWNLIESVSEGFPTFSINMVSYSFMFCHVIFNIIRSKMSEFSAAVVHVGALVYLLGNYQLSQLVRISFAKQYLTVNVVQK